MSPYLANSSCHLSDRASSGLGCSALRRLGVSLWLADCKKVVAGRFLEASKPCQFEPPSTGRAVPRPAVQDDAFYQAVAETSTAVALSRRALLWFLCGNDCRSASSSVREENNRNAVWRCPAACYVVSQCRQRVRNFSEAQTSAMPQLEPLSP